MTVTSADKDFENRSIILVAEFDEPIEEVWELWADPRKLERWWGPPTYPATFETHGLRPGGMATYYMTGPEGETPRGWWRIDLVDSPRALSFTDGFADEQGTPLNDMPVSTAQVKLSEEDGRTRMEFRSTFESVEAMERIVEMGAVEGLQAAMGQMDALLEEDE